MNELSHQFNFLNGVSLERFSDLTLRTECGNSLKLHKVVAAAISTKRFGQLSVDVNELPVRNVKFSALQNIIDFAYHGKVTLTSKHDYHDFIDAYNVLKINLGPKINRLLEEVDSAVTNDVLDKDNGSQDLVELKCVLCNKIFEFKPQLQRHVREVHNKDRVKKTKQQYSCEKCNKVYTVLFCSVQN